MSKDTCAPSDVNFMPKSHQSHLDSDKSGNGVFCFCLENQNLEKPGHRKQVSEHRAKALRRVISLKSSFRRAPPWLWGLSGCIHGQTVDRASPIIDSVRPRAASGRVPPRGPQQNREKVLEMLMKETQRVC